MDRKNKQNLIIPICSALNVLFVIGLIVFDQQWNNFSGWIFYPYMILMTINAAILVAYAVKNRQ